MGKNSSLIFYGKAKNVSVSDCIFNHIFMKAGIKFTASTEHIRRCSAVTALILLKNWCSCKTNIIRIFKMLLNLWMHLAKLGAVTFINDKDYFLILIRIHYFRISLRLNGISHLLDSYNYHLFFMILQCIIQHICTVCVIYTVFFERIILFNSLVIQVFSVNQKDN